VSTEHDWPVPQRPMGIFAIYRATARLVARTAPRGLAAAIVLIVPCYLLLGGAMHAFFLDAARIVSEHGSDLSELTPQSLGDVTGSFAFAGLTGLLLALASSVAQLATTVESWDRAVGVGRGIGGWLRRLTGRPLAMMLAQVIVLLLMVSVILFAYLLLSTVLRAAGPGMEDIALFAAMAALVYFGVATVFRLHEIVSDDRGPWRSLLSSMALVRGYFWKVLAALLPLAAVLIAGSEAISPSIDTIDINDATSIVTGYRAMASAFTPERSLLLGILSAVAQFLLTNLLTAQYVDLRARRGDFDYDEAEVIEGAME